MSGSALLALAGVLALGAISPGASFLLVVRLSATRSRAAGFAAALGLGLGCAVFALVVLCGLHVLLERVPTLHRALSIGGGLYLLWLAWRVWRGAPAVGVDSTGHRLAGTRPAFTLGLLTQLGNPQTALVFAGLFAALLPAQRVPIDYLWLPALAFVIDAAWFGCVAWLFSSEFARLRWSRARRPLDRLSALLMAGLGARLLWQTVR